ncbi:DNA excision repair protein ERCC-8 [Aphelenchoides fujianensis]|nr:DNA excision repair protein ERCC-8 [Aphelenchoides fujianensis]
MPTDAATNVVQFWANRQLGTFRPQSRRDLIDFRLRTLRDSAKHELQPWKGRPVGASSLGFDDAEQRFLLCGSCIGEVSIVDLEAPALAQPTVPWRHTTYRATASQRHRYLVSACQFYPVDSGMFVTSSMDQEVKIWDSDKMKVLDKYKSDAAVLDCHWGMPNASGLIAIALGSSCVRLIDPRTRNHIQHMRWKGKFAKCLRWMNSPSHLLLAGSESGNMVLWDIRSGRSELTEVSSRSATHTHSNERRAKQPKAHSSCISSIRCSKDGRFVVSASNDCKIHVWDAMSMQLERAVNLRGLTEGQCTSSTEISGRGQRAVRFRRDGRESRGQPHHPEVRPTTGAVRTVEAGAPKRRAGRRAAAVQERAGRTAGRWAAGRCGRVASRRPRGRAATTASSTATCK